MLQMARKALVECFHNTGLQMAQKAFEDLCYEVTKRIEQNKEDEKRYEEAMFKKKKNNLPHTPAENEMKTPFSNKIGGNKV